MGGGQAEELISSTPAEDPWADVAKTAEVGVLQLCCGGTSGACAGWEARSQGPVRGG